MPYPSTPPRVFSIMSSTSKLPTRVSSCVTSIMPLSSKLRSRIFQKLRRFLLSTGSIARRGGIRSHFPPGWSPPRRFPEPQDSTGSAGSPGKAPDVMIFFQSPGSPVALREKQKVNQKNHIDKKQHAACRADASRRFLRHQIITPFFAFSSLAPLIIDSTPRRALLPAQ